MKFNIKNRSNLNLTEMKPFLESFLPFAQKKMGFDRVPAISFVSDSENANKTLGKTAFYDPNTFSVSIYTDQRHPKDVMRSLSHELVHHAQNCRGDFDKKPEMGEGYFQNDGYMREMEREAYEMGNMCFREWEETYKKQLQESIYYSTGDNLKMSYKNWRNTEMNSLLLEKWGYRREDETLEETEDLVEGHGGSCDDAHPGVEHDHFMLSIRPLEEGEELEESDEVVEEGEGLEEDASLNESLVRKTIREAITRALKDRSNR